MTAQAHQGAGPHVLVTCAGRRVALVAALRQALMARLPRGRVFAADVAPARSAACALADGVVPLPGLADPGYGDALVDACQVRGIGLVVPTLDPELPGLAALRPRLAAAGTVAAISDPALVATWADKVATLAWLSGRGLATPRRHAGKPADFPAFVKPRHGSGSVGARVVADPLELTRARAADPTLLCLDYLPPAVWAEFTCDCFFTADGHLYDVVPRERLRVRGGEVQDAATRRNALVPLLRDRLAHVPGARGPLTLQCFVHRTDGRVVASEINARFGGGAPLSFAAGADFPGWLIDWALLGRAPGGPAGAWEADLALLRYDAQVVCRTAA